MTSWLMRISKLNFIALNDLVKELLINYKSSDPRKFFQIDINPEKMIDLQRTHVLLNKDSDSLKELTFIMVLMKFIKEPNPSVNLKTNLLLGSVQTNHRRFCVNCLKEDRYYKLIWQVSHISYCEVHHTKLITHCPKCNKDQPYFHEKLSEGECIYCGSLLYEFPMETEIYSPGEKWFYSQWRFLLQSQNNMSDCLTKSYTVLHQILFICSKQKNNFNIGEINYLSKDNKYKIMKLITKEYSIDTLLNINLDLILRILWSENQTFSSFLKIIPTDKFLNSLNDYLSRDSFMICLTPWCEYRNSGTMIKKIKNFRSNTHLSLHFCSNCSIKYGINKKIRIWEEYGDFINKICFDVLPLMKMNVNKVQIAKISGISRYKLTKIISYIAQHSLLTEDNLTPYFNLQNSVTINELSLIGENYVGETKLINLLMKKYNCSQSEAFFYYFDSNVQAFILSRRS